MGSNVLAATKLLTKLLMGATEVSGSKLMKVLHLSEVGRFN